MAGGLDGWMAGGLDGWMAGWLGTLQANKPSSQQAIQLSSHLSGLRLDKRRNRTYNLAGLTPAD